MGFDGRRRYSCETACETLEWMKAITHFLYSFKPLLDAPLFYFFKDRLWESLDEQWMDCLRRESIDNLLNIPSGVVQEHWPTSLKEFILTSRSLVMSRVPEKLQMVFPDLNVPSLGTILSGGMDMKKKHEVEVLAAVISTVANAVGAKTIVDVGAGQGYLAQVLSFEYELSVIAIDASSHHGNIANRRAAQIKKHYDARCRKSQAGSGYLNVPQTITCHVLSSDTLKALTASLSHKDSIEPSREVERDANMPVLEGSEVSGIKQLFSSNLQCDESSLVLAGLHACGDLSVTMLRTFLDCEEVKALVSVGCCYHLLSEQCSDKITSTCGFPVSNGAKLSGLSLGKRARDLASQSAERWRSLTKDAALQNFEVHAFRAAFQLVLYKYYPKIEITSPSIGRQGKALRRRKLRVLKSQMHAVEGTSLQQCSEVGNSLTIDAGEVEGFVEQYNVEVPKDDVTSNTSNASDDLFDKMSLCSKLVCDGTEPFERCGKYVLFEEFSKSAFCHLQLASPPEIELFEIWKEVKPFTELVGPYWSLRAALGPVVETLILLDRLLFLQEQGGSVAAVYPLFDPVLSPRNMAIIAQNF